MSNMEGTVLYRISSGVFRTGKKPPLAERIPIASPTLEHAVRSSLTLLAQAAGVQGAISLGYALVTSVRSLATFRAALSGSRLSELLRTSARFGVFVAALNAVVQLMECVTGAPIEPHPTLRFPAATAALAYARSASPPTAHPLACPEHSCATPTTRRLWYYRRNRALLKAKPTPQSEAVLQRRATAKNVSTALLCSAVLMLESAERRHSIALFLFPRALDVLALVGVKQGVLPLIPQAATLLFTVRSSFLFFLWRRRCCCCCVGGPLRCENARRRAALPVYRPPAPRPLAFVIKARDGDNDVNVLRTRACVRPGLPGRRHRLLVPVPAVPRPQLREPHLQVGRAGPEQEVDARLCVRLLLLAGFAAKNKDNLGEVHSHPFVCTTLH
jgi:hypothetical protein